VIDVLWSRVADTLVVSRVLGTPFGTVLLVHINLLYFVPLNHKLCIKICYDFYPIRRKFLCVIRKVSMK
jgi:riboflavin transporter FmnP